MSASLVVGHVLVGVGIGTVAASTVLATARGWRDDGWLRGVGRVAIALVGPPTRPVRRAARRLRESRVETCDRLGHRRTAWDGHWSRCRRCRATGEPVEVVPAWVCDRHLCAEPEPLRPSRGNVDDALVRELIQERLRELERPWTRYGAYVEYGGSDRYDVTTLGDQRRRIWYVE